jgi:hypothetical protein
MHLPSAVTHGYRISLTEVSRTLVLPTKGRKNHVNKAYPVATNAQVKYTPRLPLLSVQYPP